MDSPKPEKALTRQRRRSLSAYPTASGSTWRRYRRRIKIGFAICCLIAMVSARPAWAAFRRVRAETFAQEAMRWIREEQWTLAFERTRSAMQLNPQNPNALRSAARLYSRIGVDGAFPYFDSLLASGSGTDADREDLIELAIKLGNYDLAGVHARLLLEKASPSPRTRALAAEYEARRGDLRRAIDLARAAVQGSPENPEYTFLLSSLLARSPRSQERDEAVQKLWPVAETNIVFRIRALATILNAPETSRADRERVKSVLETNGVNSIDAQILRFDVRANLDPSQARAVSEDMIRSIRPASDRELRLVTGWLVSRGFANDAIQLLAGDRSLRDRGLFLIKHRALLASKEPTKAYNLLFEPAAPFAPLELEALRCQTAFALTDARLRDRHLNNAAEIAAPNVRSAVVVTHLAEMVRNPAPAMVVWRKLLSNRRTSGLALRQLAALADLHGDTVGARDFARQIAAEEPANQAVRLAVAAADLLLNENVDAALREGYRQLGANPDSAELRGLIALGHLRKGEPEKADLALQGAVIRIETAPAGLLAIITATFAANENWPDAQAMLLRIPLAALKAEEKDLLRPVIALESRLANPPEPR